MSLSTYLSQTTINDWELVASAATKLNRLLLLGVKLAQNVNLKFKSEKCINSMPRLFGIVCEENSEQIE